MKELFDALMLVKPIVIIVIILVILIIEKRRKSDFYLPRKRELKRAYRELNKSGKSKGFHIVKNLSPEEIEQFKKVWRETSSQPLLTDGEVIYKEINKPKK